MFLLSFLFEWKFWLYFIPCNICFWLLVLTVHLFMVYRHLRTFPTSPFVPIFGHVFDYMDPYKTLTILTNNLIKYGGVLRQYIGPQKPSLVVADRNFLEFLCNNSKYVCKSKFYNYMKPWLGEGLITSDGDKWLSRRKALTASFTQTSQLKKFIEVFEQNSDVLIYILDTYHNKEVNLHPLMKRLTFDVICETAMGISLNAQKTPDSEYAQSVEILCEVAQNRMTSFWKNFDFFFQFTDDCIREKRALAVVENMLGEIISQKIKEKDKNDSKKEKSDMLDLLMTVEIDGKMLTRSDLREEINTFTFAGYDTSSSAISLALYEIADKPTIQKKLLEEQKRIFKEDFKNPQVTLETLEEMTYLEMVIKETLRLHTIVPVIGKRVTKDLNYGDKKIPSMLNFSIFIHGFHHNPEYFDEPDKFIPERFAEKTDNLTYIPFGVKPRQCLGRYYHTVCPDSVAKQLLYGLGYEKRLLRRIIVLYDFKVHI